MARLNLGSAESIAALEDRGVGGPLPAGEYPAVIIKATVGEFRENSASAKAGLGRLSLEFKVTEGDFEGRKVTDFNIVNGPEFASGKPNFKMIQLFSALGWEGEFDLPETQEQWDELVSEPLGLRLGYSDPNAKGQIFNEVVRYVHPDALEESPTKSDAASVPTATATATADSEVKTEATSKPARGRNRMDFSK